MRAYALPPSVTGEDYGFYSADFLDQIEVEARDYLTEKVKEIKAKGLENISLVVNVGYGAEEIITLARKTPDNSVFSVIRNLAFCDSETFHDQDPFRAARNRS